MIDIIHLFYRWLSEHDFKNMPKVYIVFPTLDDKLKAEQVIFRDWNARKQIPVRKSAYSNAAYLFFGIEVFIQGKKV